MHDDFDSKMPGICAAVRGVHVIVFEIDFPFFAYCSVEGLLYLEVGSYTREVR
jgi:hypothetical protein